MRVLWFHPRPLLPPQGGGDLRTLGLVTEVATAGHEVLVVTAGAPGVNPSGFELLPVESRSGVGGAWAKVASRYPLRSPRPSAGDLDGARSRIADFAPHVAVVSEVMTECIAQRLLPDVPWIYDAHNVEHVLFDRMAVVAHGLYERTTFAVDRRRVARSERRLVQGSDRVIAASEEDAAGLHQLGPRRAPVVVRSSVPAPAAPADPGSAAAVALFVGTLDYLPNVAAVTELVRAVMPAVRRSVPEARLSVVGRRPTPELRALVGEHAWVELHEDAEDLSVHYGTARCVVLPIRFGGGSRLKVSEALAWGLPAVGTEAAFAGLPIPEGVVLRGETAAEIALHVAHVMADEARARELGDAARGHFERELALNVVARPLVALLDELG